MPQRSDYIYHQGNPVAYFEALSHEWTQYQYDDVSSGYTTETTGPTDASGVTEIAANTQILFDSEGSMYYVPHSNNEYEKHSNGALEWSYQADNQINAGSIVDGVLYFTDYVGQIYAINTSDGSEIYKQSPHSNVDTVCEALVHEGVLYYGSYGIVHAVNISDGSLIWEKITEDQHLAKASYAGGKLLITNQSGYLIAFDPADGSYLWQYTNSVAKNTTPAVMDGVAYVGRSTPGVSAVNVSDGSVLWETNTTGSNIEYGVAVHPDAVISADENGNVYAHDPGDGSLLWEFNDNYESRVPIIAQDNVYLSLDGTWFGFKVSDGTKLFSMLGTANANEPPTPHKGTLYAPYPPPA